MRTESRDDKILVREITKLKVTYSHTFLTRVAVLIRYTLIKEEG